MGFHLNSSLRNNPETSRIGAKWTDEEEASLLELIKTSKDIKDIAKEHHRTVGGIKCRLRDIAIRMIENNEKSIEEVCTIVRMTTEEIYEAQKRRTAKTLRWTDEEVDWLVQRVKEGQDLKDIALLHNRTENAIKNKLLEKAIKLIDVDNLGVEVVRQQLNLNIEEINDYREKQQNILATKKNKAASREPFIKETTPTPVKQKIQHVYLFKDEPLSSEYVRLFEHLDKKLNIIMKHLNIQI